MKYTNASGKTFEINRFGDRQDIRVASGPMPDGRWILDIGPAADGWIDEESSEEFDTPTTDAARAAAQDVACLLGIWHGRVGR